MCLHIQICCSPLVALGIVGNLYVFAVSALHVHLLISIVEIAKLVKCCHYYLNCFIIRFEHLEYRLPFS